jgi:hypothetical protein
VDESSDVRAPLAGVDGIIWCFRNDCTLSSLSLSSYHPGTPYPAVVAKSGFSNFCIFLLLRKILHKRNGHARDWTCPRCWPRNGLGDIEVERRYSLGSSVVDAWFFFLLFHGFFELGALLGLDVSALLALFVELLFGAEEFDEGLFGAIALLKAGLDDT